MDETATGAVVSFIMEAELSDFPEDVTLEAKRCITDGIAVILAGSEAPASAILRRQIRPAGGACCR